MPTNPFTSNAASAAEDADWDRPTPPAAPSDQAPAATATTVPPSDVDPSIRPTSNKTRHDKRSTGGKRMTETDHRRVVAIDGGAAAGKTTVAQLLADRIGATLFDTGVLYRTVTLAALRDGIAPFDDETLATLAAGLDIQVRRPTIADGRLYDVLLADEDVTWAIRDAAVDANVSEVSAHRAVRQNLLPIQRRIADRATVVMVGRDVGTVVVSDAGVKIFLDASLDERARRRWSELQQRGKDMTMAEVLADLRARDAIDSGRDVAPLRAASDAAIVQTDGKSIESVVEEIERLVRAAWARDER